MNNQQDQTENAIQNPQIDRNILQFSKSQIKAKINSRQDFISLFGFESYFKSGLFASVKKTHFLAVYCKSSRGEKTID